LVIGEIAAIDRDSGITVCLAANRQLPSLQYDCEVGLVVKIRYAELQAGLHVDAQTRGGDTVVYLLPGLTAEQRRVALTRARNLGRLGHGPRLSATSLAVAVGADRIRTTFSNGSAAVRSHPILLLPSVLAMSGTLFALASLAAVTFHLPAATGVAVSNGMRTQAGAYSSTQPVYRPKHAAAATSDMKPRSPHRGRHAQAWIGREELPRADWSATSARSPMSGGSCLVYGIFGVCENS
jgi:hypothetical protein